MHQLIDSNILSVFSWDLQGGIIDANEAFSKLTGYSREEFLSGTVRWNEITPPKWQGVDAAAVAALMHTGIVLPYEKEFIHKSGARIPVLIGGALDAHSEKTGVSFVVDLTQRRRMEQALRESEDRYSIVAETANDAIITVDDQSVITYVNPATEKIFGYQSADLHGRTLDVLMPPHIQSACGNLVADCIKTGGGCDGWDRKEIPAMHKDGHVMLLEMSLGELRRADKHLFTVIAHDITERKKSETLCVRENKILEMIATGRLLPEILKDLVEMIEDQCPGMVGSVLLLDEDGTHIRHGAAPHLPAAYNHALDGESIGPQAGSCGTAMYRHQPVIVADIWSDPLWANYRDLAAQSGLRACWSTPIFSSQGKVLGTFAMYYHEVRSPRPEELRLADLASHIAGIAIERKRTEDYISHMAHHDALTGLPNRVMLQANLGHAIIRAKRYKNAVAVIFIDLDNFKTINDSLGHHIGDLLLKAVAERLQQGLRDGDEVARLGGDEFVIILTTPLESDEAGFVASRILTRLERPFTMEGHELHIGSSIGISLYPTDGESVEQLMQAADTAMYHAKEQGRGNYQFFTQSLNAAIQRRMTTESQLRHALARGEFALHYQPQINMKDGRIFAAEALLRWHQPERGLIPPAEFIQVAEDTGLILPIGEWILRKACDQLKLWRAAGFLDLKIAVNLSTRQMFQLDLVEAVSRILDEAQLPAGALNLEITETILMRPSDENLMVLRKLGHMGIQLSMDDFGTGYSNLAYLRQFPIHALKIDQSFVRGIGHDRNDMAITDAIIAMAKSLHLQVIAEGVETAEQAAFLEEHGCLSAQGYYYSRPLAADAFADLVHLRGLTLPQ